MRIGLSRLVFIIASSALAGTLVTALLAAGLDGIRRSGGPADP